MGTTTGRTSEQPGAADAIEPLSPVPPRPVNPRYESYLHGFSSGFHARDDEVARLQAENDRLYLLAHNTPAQVAEIQQRRLDGHFRAEEQRFFADAARKTTT